MKHLLCSFTLCALAASAPLHAADEIATRWNDLCQVASGRQLDVTTSDGRTVSGICTSTDAESLALTHNQRLVRIARSTLTRIQMYDPGKGHHLADLGDSLSRSFKTSFGWLFSPAAPLGLVAIPATVAWGAVAAPFCLLGDMDDGRASREIKLTN
jgi:hypothetical protein